ncbi:MAG: ABC transporter permease [Truepera sp.]|jgi:ABC-type dipeptide/oligopeptide/nickel transport system permease component|nr:ABC transporter permease [Truepera sp.]
MGTAEFLVRRLFTMIPVLVGVTVLVFMVLHLAPGDPIVLMLGTEWTPERAAVLKAEMGLDRPLPAQYISWLGGLFVGDLGTQYTTREPVLRAIVSRVPTTLILAGGAMVVATLISIPLGFLSAVKQGTWIDSGLRILALIGISMPVFWLGIVLIIVFAVNLRLLPAGGGLAQHGWKAFILPCVALGTSFAALLMRMTRSSVLDVIRQDYVRTAEAKGLSKLYVLSKHVFKNAAIPIATVAGLQLGAVLGGAVLTEIIFSLPGLGRLLYAAINSRDYPTLQGTILFVALAFVTINLLIDLLYAVLDPRVKYG